MNLHGKTLLVLTGCNASADIIDYARAQGVYTIATDYHKASSVKDTAHVRYDVSTTDIGAVEHIARSHNVDGITTGTSESSMYTILQLSKRLGLPFYATTQQLEILNDKQKFKELMLAHGVPVTTGYSDLSSVELPVVVKPVDSSGSKGISVARTNDELVLAIEHALKYSRSKKYVVEKYIQNACEVFVNYTMVDGVISLTCAFDNTNKVRHNNSISGLGVFRMFPSRYMADYVNMVHDNMVSALRSIGVRNGVISIQSFYDGKSFMVYEAGYRLGGTQSYIFTKEVNGISHMEMMVNYSLTGRMAESADILLRDEPCFCRPCCQYNIPLRPGVISSMGGIAEIREFDGVLNVTQVRQEGDLVHQDGTTSQLGVRIHIVGRTTTDLGDIIDQINKTLSIKDQDGADMIYGRYRL